MVQIDKSDVLYKYLTGLGIDDADSVYLELAENGRYKLSDVRQYFREIFTPSQTESISEEELEKVVDYYADLKTIKALSSSEIKEQLKQYKSGKTSNVDTIINAYLKDVLYMCLNYSTLHKNVDLQDLIQIANIGLMEALEKYNEQAKIEFIDYVVFYVRKNIKEFEEKTNG